MDSKFKIINFPNETSIKYLPAILHSVIHITSEPSTDVSVSNLTPVEQS